MLQEDDESLLPASIPLSSENINDDGIYLLENGEDGLIYIGNMANPETLQQIFGVSSVDGLPAQVTFVSFSFFALTTDLYIMVLSIYSPS